MSTTLTNSFVVKAIAALVVVATLITMTGVASIAPVSAQVVVDGSLVKTADNPDVYIVKIIGSKTFKRLILNPTIFESYGHLSWDNIITVSQSTLDSYTTSNLVIEVNPDGSAVNGKVYVLTSSDGADTGTKQHLNVSASEFEAAGLDWASLYHINQIEAGAGFYPEGAAITDASEVPGADGDGGNGGDLSGDEAVIKAIELKKGSDRKVAEGENGEVAIFEFDVEDGDVSLDRLDVAFNLAGTTEKDPEDIFEDITLLLDGDKVGSIDGSDEDNWSSEGTVHTVRISGLSAVVREGDTGKVSIEVELNSAINNIAGATEEDVVVSIPANGARFSDALGINQYVDTDDTVTFDIVSEDADDALTLSTSSDDPDATTFQVEADDESDQYTVLVAELETGDNDVTIDEIMVTVTTADGGDGDGNYEDVVESAELVIDGTVFDDYDVADEGTTTADLTFDLDEFELDGDEEYDVEVRLTFRAQDGNYTSGSTTVQATIVAASIDAEGVDDITVGDNDDNVTGEEHTLSLSVAEISGVSADVSKDEAEEIGFFSFEFTVEANGGDVAFDVGDVTFTLFGPGDGDEGTGVLTFISGNATNDGGTYTVAEGKTAKFVFDVTVDPDAGNTSETGTYRVQLETVAGTDVDFLSTSTTLIDAEEA